MKKKRIPNWEKFMLESNRIEGEDRLNPGDEEAFDLATGGIESQEDILNIHSVLTKHLDVDWSGKWRTHDVRVGQYVAPPYIEVPKLMDKYFKDFWIMHPWIAHNEFEKIHPFVDFNGRTGRLIWLPKAITICGYDFSIPFLQEYYYQTLFDYQTRTGGV